MNWARASGRTMAPAVATAVPLPGPVLVMVFLPVLRGAAAAGPGPGRTAACRGAARHPGTRRHGGELRSARPLLGYLVGGRSHAQQRTHDGAGRGGDPRAADHG